MHAIYSPERQQFFGVWTGHGLVYLASQYSGLVIVIQNDEPHHQMVKTRIYY